MDVTPNENIFNEELKTDEELKTNEDNDDGVSDNEELAKPLPDIEINLDEDRKVRSSDAKVIKRKRKHVEEECNTLQSLTEIFLRVVYPLSVCLSRNVTVGLFKEYDYKPNVMLSQGVKSIIFNEESWNSFNNYLHLIECYIMNKINGKKTSIRLAASDIEIENVKLRGLQCVRFRDLTKHDVKVHLNSLEFHMLSSSMPALNRYMRQLVLVGSTVKTYLESTVENEENMAIMYGAIDSSIFNRLPHEVHLYRQMKTFNVLVENLPTIEATMIEGEDITSVLPAQVKQEHIDL